jgi:hypothetical protein
LLSKFGFVFAKINAAAAIIDCGPARYPDGGL